MTKKAKVNSNSNQKKEMTCSPSCIFFPDMSCSEWKYDEKDPNIKRRTIEKQFICGYDGHIICDWYGKCPKKNDGITI